MDHPLTLDLAMWGSDQAALVAIISMDRLVQKCRDNEQSLDDVVKCLSQGISGP